MKELFSLIIDLLHTDACVVVPGLGGFVTNRRAASVDERSGLFCPPSVQVVFNPKLNHNDGLLCQAWAAYHNCSLVDASKQINAVVDEVKNTIAAKGALCVPGFGTLRIHGRSYSFVSGIDQQGFSESFGLQEFRLPAIEPEQRRSTAQVKKVLGIGAVAAMMTAVLLVPTHNQTYLQNMASLLPISFNNSQTIKTLSTVTARASQISQAADALSVETTDKEEPALSQTPSSEGGLFYVVLKSFSTTAEADSFVGRWQPRLSDKLAVVPVTEGFVVVACANTANPELASKMMENVRSKSSFKDTFILYK